MKKQYHILNGDALKDQFPSVILGDRIVARECLVDGNVEGCNLKELFKNRAIYLSQNYGGSEEYYYTNVKAEFDKLKSIDEGSEINLWFEDDLFCQVNFWFVIHLVNHYKLDASVFLVRPERHTQYGFGGLSETALLSIYNDKLLLTELNLLKKMWQFYQKNDLNQLKNIATVLEPVYPFIAKAVTAHVERIPSDGQLGRPKESLIQIMKELESTEFGPVFKEFCRRESIYGYGDLQIKKLYDEILNEHDLIE